MTSAMFTSMQEFYDGHGARERSPETDFGSRWRDDDERWPVWRVSYIDLTGELYAVRLGPATGDSIGPVEILGRFPLRSCATCNGSGGSTTACPACSGTGYSRELVQAVLAGWATINGEPDSLEWARRRARGEPAPTPTQPFARAREAEFRV